ncbi:MAG: DNA-directed RNA polymerase subunit beta [Rickettsiales bacterium]|jgi:DNA-directed RNA polymerase subunit beta|nr:DNA-directed RNA polymerase subunit beta [Rickettsiales bacterium]
MVANSSYVLRRCFSDKKDEDFVQDLIFLQKDSFRSFICLDNNNEEERENSKINKALMSFFPIVDNNRILELEYVRYRVGEMRYTMKECINSGRTYSIPLYATLRLYVYDENSDVEKREIKAIKEQEVFLCDIPLMTETGSFVINGIERVVVSQMRRTLGVFFDSEEAKMFTGIGYTAKIIPMTGPWLDFSFDSKDRLFFSIDTKKKLPIGHIFKLLGMSIEEVINYFYRNLTLEYKSGKWLIEFDYNSMLGKTAEDDIINEETGEVVISKGRRVTKRLLNQLKEKNFKECAVKDIENIYYVFSKDVVDEKSGEVVYKTGDELNYETIKDLEKLNITKLLVANPDSSEYGPYIFNTLEKEKSKKVAMMEMYKSIKVMEEASSPEVAEKFVYDLFFTPKYNLSEVGRMKMNYRLGLNIDPNVMHLTKEDILTTIKLLSKIKRNDEKTDDIDNLGNRRLRTSGELVEMQFRIGMAKIERTIQEKMNTLESETIMPQNLINTKPLMATIADFFATSQLSQFMDQTNPISELSHKRRITALGPGGVMRDRATFDMRDIHYTHYGKICPLESPDGSNIGLISNLSIFARINKYGFIETPYKRVENGRITDDIVYLSAIEENGKVFAPCNLSIDNDGKIVGDYVVCRKDAEILQLSPDKVDYVDVSPRQTISVAAALIPFIEKNESRRVSMGVNMLKQAVPLQKPEAPYVGTGIEGVVARYFNCGAIISNVDGIVKYVDANRIVIEKQNGEQKLSDIHTFRLDKYLRTNHDTTINQFPTVEINQKVEDGQIIADSQSIDNGELALGKNVLVGFITWNGYSYEDSILLSERLVMDNVFTSIHLEEFEVEAKDTKLGPEEITRDIPNVGEELLKKLDETGVVYIGAHVKAGDILVGKTTPKSGAPQTPEEKLLRVVFGEKATDVRDSSLRLPPSVPLGVVVDVKVYTRNGLDKDERARSIDNMNVDVLNRDKEREIYVLRKNLLEKIKPLILNKALDKNIDRIKKGTIITEDFLEDIALPLLQKISVSDSKAMEKVEKFLKEFKDIVQKMEENFENKAKKVKECDELPQSSLKKIKIIIATKQKIQPGDKMSGRYGNKGVVSRVLPIEDMPYTPDGTPIDIVLSPLGVASRMNLGQVFEAHLGLAAVELGKQISKLLEKTVPTRAKLVREKLLRIYKVKKEQDFIGSLSDEDLLDFASSLKKRVPFSTGSFENITADKIEEILEEAGLDKSGQTTLIDGRTGEPFDRPVTVGYVYMLKLHHLADDKIHARATGPYSLITQQPLGGKSHFGGQ